MLPATIHEHVQQLHDLCREYGVVRLEVFGSATTPEFDSATSDLDFIVEFEDLPSPAGFADRYFGLLESLQKLFGRPVDLLVLRAIRNPYFLEAIQPSRTLLYAA